MSYSVLDRVCSPEQLKSLSRTELSALCDEIRSFLIEKVAKTGGHLPSSVVIEGLLIDDSEAAEFEGYTGPSVFNSFGRTPGQAEPFPFGTKCNITLKGISVVSKKPLVIARNPDAFPGLVVVWE